MWGWIITLLLGALLGLFLTEWYHKYFPSAELKELSRLHDENRKSQDKIDKLQSKMATLDQQNQILSISAKMLSFMATGYDVLTKKYPEGYFLFASNKYTVIPSNDKAKIFKLSWENTKVNLINDAIIHIHLKNFFYHPNDISVENLDIVLERKTGSIADGIVINNIGLFVELLDYKDDEYIYLIGFRKPFSLPTERNINPIVEAYLKKLDLLIFSIINTNDKKHLVIKDWAISSGWEPKL